MFTSGSGIRQSFYMIPNDSACLIHGLWVSSWDYSIQSVKLASQLNKKVVLKAQTLCIFWRQPMFLRVQRL